MSFNTKSSSSEVLRRCSPVSITMSSFSEEEIRRIGVVKVSTPLSFNAIGHPLPRGLYDPALGPIDMHGLCTTCNNRAQWCPGHFGFIELPVPVINPLFHRTVGNILRISCLSCHKVLLSKGWKVLLTGQIKLLNHGQISQALNMANSFPQLAQSKSEKGKDVSAELLALAIAESYIEEALANSPSQDLEVKGDGEYRSRFVKEAISSLHVGKRCPNCGQALTRVTFLQNKILVPVSKVEVAEKFSVKCAKQNAVKDNVVSSNFSFMLPSECEKHLKAIWENDADVLKAIVPALEANSGQHPIDFFFMKVVPVTPTLARPVCITNGLITEHPQNDVYKAILNDCLMVRSIVQVMNNDTDTLSKDRKEVVEKLKGSTYTDKLQYAWQDLQVNVNSLLDIEAKRERHAAGIGLKQVIEKKEGIIRMNMMGKRVNYAARTVITPDPNLNIDEIGIPEVFAKQLTYPVPVTPWNAQDLRQLIKNGPDVHPGANFVESEDGVIVRLDSKDLVQRESVAKRLLTPGDKKGIKILHRHLHNGDVLLLNRQPTLHRPSIMAHKARVLKGEKTFRLHYANCKSYNADFDGDEMNAHFPQNDVARSEAYNLVSVCNQYLVPKDGTPLSGLIQDHMVSGVRLSKRDTFFTRGTYMQLIFQALPYLEGDIKTLPPCIIKPVQLWSGKQVFSTVIINVTPKGLPPLHLLSNAKIDYKAWFKSKARVSQYGGTPLKHPQEMTEAEVVIRHGELLNGVLDKTHYGATPYSLVHCMYELYGGETSSKLLSSFSKLLTAFLQIEGFTLGVEDILVTEKADQKRTSIIETIRHLGNQIVTNVIDPSPGNIVNEVEDAMKTDPQFRNVLDREYKVSLDSYTNEINKTCLPAGLAVPFPENNLQLMVQSGAKGSTVNTMQISCLLGQIELEGKRPPLMISGKSLPSFPPYDPSPRAGGFVDGRFMTGIQPQEFFFHCMAGREGLIDTAVKTSRSGYLQRCLVKHLEGLSIQYDMTVRDSDGSLIQYAYGEDGMEISKAQFLKEKLLPFLIDNLNVIYNENTSKRIKDENYAKIKKYCKKIKSWNKHQTSRNQRQNGFIIFAEEKKNELDIKRKINKKSGRLTLTEELCRQWASLDSDTKNEYEKKSKPLPDPVVSQYPPDINFGSIPETLENLIDNYCKKNPGVISRDGLREMVSQKAMTSLCPPGEPVGLLAAQSIGEPSTQMTLNTFHFAGRGEMNVTLGIPRLREILMVASRNIKTPAVDVPFRMDAPKLEKRAEKLRRRLMKVTLADVLESVEVTETFELSPVPLQVYNLKMNFLKRSEYRHDTDVSPKQILMHVEKKFLRQLTSYLRAKKKKEIKELISSEGSTFSGGAKGKQEDEEADNFESEPAAEKLSKMKTGTMENYESSDDEPIGDDDDATTERRRARHQEEQQYSDLEDEDDEVQIELGKEEEEEEWNNEDTQEVKKESNPSIDAAEESNRKSLVLEQDCVMDYKFDTVEQEWCEVKLGYSLEMGRIDFGTKFKYMVAHSVIKEVPGIKRAFILTNSAGNKVLRTDGINVREMYNNCDILDINKLYTNDIYIMSQIYGIEAACKVLVKEIQEVFKVYGITVDPRHLSLVADYMMFSGVYLPLSRTGMEGGTSPLQQMSFESCLTFLRSAVLRNKKDDLRSPSSRLMMGLPCKSGTGAFDLIHKITV